MKKSKPVEMILWHCWCGADNLVAKNVAKAGYVFRCASCGVNYIAGKGK
jgi:hypothetical protein